MWNKAGVCRKVRAYLLHYQHSSPEGTWTGSQGLPSLFLTFLHLCTQIWEWWFFCCCCFHVEKNARSFLQSKHLEAVVIVQISLKTSTPLTISFWDCREHNETEISHGAFIPVLSNLIESSRGCLDHQCQCHFRVCFGFILKKNGIELINYFLLVNRCFTQKKSWHSSCISSLFSSSIPFTCLFPSGVRQKPEIEWGLLLIAILAVVLELCLTMVHSMKYILCGDPACKPTEAYTYTHLLTKICFFTVQFIHFFPLDISCFQNIILKDISWYLAFIS